MKPQAPRIKAPTPIRQTPDATFGSPLPAMARVPRPIDFNFALWIPCCSNLGQRGFSDEYIQLGHGGMWDTHFADRILSTTAGVVWWWMPGGAPEYGDLLEFDHMTQCRKNTTTAHLGNTADLWYAMAEAKKIGRKVALYTGSTIPMNPLGTDRIEEIVMSELGPYKGVCDMVCIDAGCAAVEGDAYCVAHRIITRELGMECLAETRGLVGRYSAINGHAHVCTSDL